MRTVLIRPNASKQYSNLNKLRAIELPLWLSCMASRYENPFIIDAEVEELDKDELRGIIGVLDPTEIIILATGSHPSAHIQQKQEAIKLFEHLKTSFTAKMYDYLPFNPLLTKPRYDLLMMDKYRAHNWHCWGGWERQPYGAVFSSISCPYKCQFCSVKSFYRTHYQKRNIKDVCEDFITQFEDYGVKNFKMMDELFVTNTQHTRDICSNLAETIGKDVNIWSYARIDTVNEQLLKLLKKAGVRWLAYGIESGNDEIRKSMMKGNFNKQKIKDIIKMTKDCGINVVGNYMFGFWEDTSYTLQETLDFAIELNCEYANFYCVVAYPNSELYNIMEDRGVKMPRNFAQYAQMSEKFLPLPTKYLTAKTVLDFRDKAFLEYFTNSNYLNYIEKRFGKDTRKEIKDMTDIKVERYGS